VVEGKRIEVVEGKRIEVGEFPGCRPSASTRGFYESPLVVKV